jgi:putative flippase GtrA
MLRSELARQMLRYGAVGVINTVIGAAVVFSLDRSGLMGPGAANACGLAVGLMVSFLLHRQIFPAERSAWENGRYAIAVLIAFASNQVVLHVGLALLSTAPSARLLCQVAGVATYSATLFALSRLWVFRGPVDSTHTV